MRATSLAIATLVACAGRTWAANFANTSTAEISISSSADIAAAILSGLGATTVESTLTEHVLATLTGSGGLLWAQSCDNARSSWLEASATWALNGSLYREEAVTSTQEFTYSAYTTPSKTEKPTSLTTLCDGRPRAVGRATYDYTTKAFSASTTTFTVFSSDLTARYPTPPPCSIEPSDCQSLHDSITASWSSAGGSTGSASLLTPNCTTVTPVVAPSACQRSWENYESSKSSHDSVWEEWRAATKISANVATPTIPLEFDSSPTCSNPTSTAVAITTDSDGNRCDSCIIWGEHARVLYWPVTTKEGTGNLCNNTIRPVTIPGTRTGDGPNTFVTSGLTITSPTVALSFSNLQRRDGCGTTVQDFIIPVKPDEVTSIRGYRVFFDPWPFNFADLNWQCGNKTVYGEPDEDQRDFCFQKVPSDAYFRRANGIEWVHGIDYWDQDRSMGEKMDTTIYPDYHPQLLLPETMSPMMNSIWAHGGDSCQYWPNGVFDPPKAVGKVEEIKGVSLAPGEITSTAATQEPTPATPASTIEAVTSPTAQSEKDEPSTSAETTTEDAIVESAPATAEPTAPSSDASLASPADIEPSSPISKPSEEPGGPSVVDTEQTQTQNVGEVIASIVDWAASTSANVQAVEAETSVAAGVTQQASSTEEDGPDVTLLSSSEVASSEATVAVATDLATVESPANTPAQTSSGPKSTQFPASAAVEQSSDEAVQASPAADGVAASTTPVETPQTSAATGPETSQDVGVVIASIIGQASSSASNAESGGNPAAASPTQDTNANEAAAGDTSADIAQDGSAKSTGSLSPSASVLPAGQPLPTLDTAVMFSSATQSAAEEGVESASSRPAATLLVSASASAEPSKGSDPSPTSNGSMPGVTASGTTSLEVTGTGPAVGTTNTLSGTESSSAAPVQTDSSAVVFDAGWQVLGWSMGIAWLLA